MSDLLTHFLLQAMEHKLKVFKQGNNLFITNFLTNSLASSSPLFPEPGQVEACDGSSASKTIRLV